MLGGLGSNMMYRLSVDDTRIPTSTFLGTTPEPPPVDRNAPGALFGLSAQDEVFWELVSSQAVYVAQLTPWCPKGAVESQKHDLAPQEHH
jgi:hypothetical protein